MALQDAQLCLQGWVGLVIVIAGSCSTGAGGLVCQAHPAPRASRDRNQVADGDASHIAWTIAAVN